MTPLKLDPIKGKGGKFLWTRRQIEAIQDRWQAVLDEANAKIAALTAEVQNAYAVADKFATKQIELGNVLSRWVEERTATATEATEAGDGADADSPPLLTLGESYAHPDGRHETYFSVGPRVTLAFTLDDGDEQPIAPGSESITVWRNAHRDRQLVIIATRGEHVERRELTVPALPAEAVGT